MRRIGMLGGMSWESTAEYYRLANEGVRERLGGHHSARILLDSVDFAEIEAMQSGGDWDAAGRMLASRAAALEQSGAELLVLCTNTMHAVIDEIERAVRVPVLHIADAVSDAIRARGLRRVALLGTAFTMDHPFYPQRLGEHGIEVLLPEPEDRRTVHAVIYDELVHGIIREESRAAYRAILGRLERQGAEGVILGCTEIELLVSDADSRLPLFPTTRLHVEAALDAALSAS